MHEAVEQEGAATASREVKSCRRRAAHLQPLSKGINLLCEKLFVNCAARNQITVSQSMMGKRLIDSMKKKTIPAWLQCKQIHQLLLCGVLRLHIY